MNCYFSIRGEVYGLILSYICWACIYAYIVYVWNPLLILCLWFSLGACSSSIETFARCTIQSTEKQVCELSCFGNQSTLKSKGSNFGPKESHDSEKVQVGQHDWAVNIPFRVYNLCIMCTHTQFNVLGTRSSGNDVNNIEIIGTCTVLSSGQYKVNKIERALATSFNYGAKLRQLSEYTLCPLFWETA